MKPLSLSRGCLHASPATRRSRLRRGASLAIALATLLAVTLVAAAVVRSTLAAHRQAQVIQNELQAQWLAECAVDRAVVQLAADSSYEGETWQPAVGQPMAEAGDDRNSTSPAPRGVATIKVGRPDDDSRSGQSGRVRIEGHAHYPEHEWRRVAVSRTYELPIQP
jgi:hypothetical protein